MADYEFYCKFCDHKKPKKSRLLVRRRPRVGKHLPEICERCGHEVGPDTPRRVGGEDR